jgi:hypothetical protein
MPAAPGPAELVGTEFGESGEQRRGFREHDFGERFHECRHRDRILLAGALERILRTRVEGSEQSADVHEEFQRLARGQALPGGLYQVAWAAAPTVLPGRSPASRLPGPF